MTETVLRRTLLITLLTVFCGVVFHAPISVWLGTIAPDYQLIIKSWKEVLIGVTAVLVLIQASRRHMWNELSRDWVIRLSIIFVALHLVLLPFMWQGALPTIAGLMINLRFVVFFMVAYVALKIYPEWRRPFIWGGIVAAAISLLFTVLQVTVLPHDILKYIGYSKDTIAPYLTVDQNYDFIRVNGTLRGPNPLGIYGVIVIAAVVAGLAMAWKRLASMRKFLPWVVAAVGVAAVITLWFSYSRSAKIAAVVAVVVVAIVLYGKYISRSLWIALALAATVLIGGVYLARDTPFVSVVILHEDPNEGNDVNSNDGHWESLIDGTDRMIRQPFGAGVGSTGSPSLLGKQPLIIENYYLYVAHEVGWVGLGVFVALFVVVLKRLWQRRRDWLALSVLASGIGIAVASLFLPVWADDTVSIVWWGLAGVALATPMIKKKGVKNG